jgi:hypothetical protein
MAELEGAIASVVCPFYNQNADFLINSICHRTTFMWKEARSRLDWLAYFLPCVALAGLSAGGAQRAIVLGEANGTRTITTMA